MEEREERVQRLKRLKRKRILTVVVLCAALAGLGGGYFVLNQINAKKAAEEAKKKEQQAEVKEEITAFSMTEVKTFEFANKDNSYRFTWEEEEDDFGRWIKQDERDFPTNEQKLQNIIGVLFVHLICLFPESGKLFAGL